MSKKIFGIKVKEFLNLAQEEQSEWVDINIPDYETLCYDDGYLGAFYPVDIVDIDEYLNDRDAYGVSGLISGQDPEIDESRIEEIDNGAELTKAETYQLYQAIAEDDFFGWLTHNSFEIHLLDGTLHLYFQGKSISVDGFKFEYNRAFQTYKTMLEYISDLPLSYVE